MTISAGCCTFDNRHTEVCVRARGFGDLFERAERGCRVRSAAHADEDVVGAGDGVGVRVPGEGRDELVGQQRAGAHRRVRVAEHTDRRHGRGSHDSQPRRCSRSAAHHDGVTDLFVKLIQCDFPKHNLVGRVEPMTGKDRGRYVGLGSCADHGDGLPVDLKRGEVDAAPRGDVVIVVEEFGHLVLGDVAVALTRAQFVGPVPPVERGMRHEVVEAGAEGEGGGDHDDRERGAEDRRTHRHRVATHTRFEREADPRHCRHGQAPRRRCTREARSVLRGPGTTAGDAVRCAPVRDRTSATALNATISTSTPKPSTVQSNAMTGRRVNRASGPERRERRQPDGDHERHRRSDDRPRRTHR